MRKTGSPSQFWAKCSAVVALLFYSTMAVDSKVKYRPEFIISVFIFSILPLICFYKGIKYNSQRWLQLYTTIQGISALCNMIGIISIYIYVANEHLCTNCDWYIDNCTVVDGVLLVTNCKEMYILNIVYSILYIIMTYINIKSITALQYWLLDLQARVPDSEVGIQIIKIEH